MNIEGDSWQCLLDMMEKAQSTQSCIKTMITYSLVRVAGYKYAIRVVC